MIIINQKSIVEINEEKATIENKEVAITSLGEELAMEKMKNMQKDVTISNLGEEFSKMKLDIMILKGGK